MRYKICADRVKLYDSYIVPKSRFELEMNIIRYNRPTCRLWERSINSLRREWATHTLLYNMKIQQEKTKDCDLEYKQKWYAKIGYAIIGTIALWLIK